MVHFVDRSKCGCSQINPKKWNIVLWSKVMVKSEKRTLLPTSSFTDLGCGLNYTNRVRWTALALKFTSVKEVVGNRDHWFFFCICAANTLLSKLEMLPQRSSCPSLVLSCLARIDCLMSRTPHLIRQRGKTSLPIRRRIEPKLLHAATSDNLKYSLAPAFVFSNHSVEKPKTYRMTAFINVMLIGILNFEGFNRIRLKRKKKVSIF